MSAAELPPAEPAPAPARRGFLVPLVLVLLGVAVVAVGQRLFSRAQAGRNTVALSDAPRPVTVTAAHRATYRASRRYVGTLEPWLSAQVGPSVVSAFLSDISVRPGALVTRGSVLARLDCRVASTATRTLAAQARASQARQAALAHQAARFSGLLDGGFVAENEVEQRRAESESEQARMLATQAQLAGAALGESDCVLRAPFDGEVSERLLDPGAFVRPGTTILMLIDRSVVRVAADVPESDFDSVAPGTPVHVRLLAGGRELDSTVTRRSPSADPSTRTVHIELDLPNPTRALPVRTTADLTVDVGTTASALEVPLATAQVRGARASVFVVEGEVAHARTLPVLGERGSSLYLAPQLPEGALLVTEGRGLLVDGDRVRARTEALAASPPDAGAPRPSESAR